MLAASAVAVSVALVWVIPGAENDFIYDWLSARSFVAGEDPYRSIGALAADEGLVSGQPLSEIHPRTPGALVLLAPIGIVPYPLSYVVGRLLTVASAFLLAWVVSRIIGVHWQVALTVAPVLLLVWPFSTVLQFSQTGYLVAAMIGGTWLLGDRAIAGLPLGAAICLKAWPWLLAPALWLSGRRNAAYGTAGVVVGLNLLGLLSPAVTVSGLAGMLDDAVTFSSSSLSTDLGMSTWYAAAVGLVSVVAVARLTDNPYAWSILIALAAAPFVWIHYLPALIIPLAILSVSTRPVNSRWPDLSSDVRPGTRRLNAEPRR